MKAPEFQYHVRVTTRHNGIVSNTSFPFTHKKPAWDFAVELGKLWRTSDVEKKNDDKMIVSLIKENLEESSVSTTLFTQVCN